MGVASVGYINMKIHARMRRQRLEEVLEQIQIEAFYPPMRQLNVVYQIGSTAEVHGHLRERLVKRNPGRPKSPDAFFLPQSLLQRLPENDSDILHCMVVVNV